MENNKLVERVKLLEERVAFLTKQIGTLFVYSERPFPGVVRHVPLAKVVEFILTVLGYELKYRLVPSTEWEIVETKSEERKT